MANPLDFLIEPHEPRNCPFKWSTVTSVDPLRVKIDGPGGPLPITPQSLVGDLNVGDRVLATFTNHRRNKLVIFGRAGGVGGGVIGNNENLNNYDVTGVWHQRLNAYAETGQNYPVNYAGLLEVHADGQMVYQVYTTYNQRGRYWRSKYQSTWRSWERISIEGHTHSWGQITGKPAVPYAMAAGVVSVTAGSNGIGMASVSFPAGRFTVTPIITVSAHSASGVLTNAQFTDPSRNGFTAVLLRSNDIDTSIHWHAVQMTSSSAAG